MSVGYPYRSRGNAVLDKEGTVVASCMNDDIAEQVAKTLNRKTEPKETIILRLRPTLRKQVDEAARNAGVSRNAFITDALAKQMEE